LNDGSHIMFFYESSITYSSFFVPIAIRTAKEAKGLDLRYFD